MNENQDPMAGFDGAFNRLDEKFKREFDNDRNKFERTVKRGVKVVVLIWALAVLGGVTLGAIGIYVTCHFLAKVW